MLARLVGRPNIISTGHHQRSARSAPSPSASSVPFDSVTMISKPCAGGRIPPCRRGSSRAHRAVGTTAQRNLVHDRRAIDQPADGADVGPGQRRIVERSRNIWTFPPASNRPALRAKCRASRRRHRDKDRGRIRPALLPAGLPAAQRRRARDPVAFGQHADDFGMGVLGNLPRQRLAIGRRHPVVRLDPLVGIDARLELGGACGVLDVAILRRRTY